MVTSHLYCTKVLPTINRYQNALGNITNLAGGGAPGSPSDANGNEDDLRKMEVTVRKAEVEAERLAAEVEVLRNHHKEEVI